MGYQLFVGAISPGVSDSQLLSLFAAVAPVQKLTRETNSVTGVKAGFGFVEYNDLAHVASAVEYLNGVEIASQASDGAMSKKLVVKADAKIQSLVEAYKSKPAAGKVKAKNDPEQIKARVNKVLDSFKRPMAVQSAGGANNGSFYDSTLGALVPTKLQDLDAREIPIAQRGLITGSIAQFRQSAVSREALGIKRDVNGREKSESRTAGPSRETREISETKEGPVQSVPKTFAELRQRDEERERERLERQRRAPSPRQRQEDERLDAWEKRLDEEEREMDEEERAKRLDEKLHAVDERQELFWTNRRRWMEIRQRQRRKEEDEDEADRREEEAEKERSRVKSAQAVVLQARDKPATHAVDSELLKFIQNGVRQRIGEVDEDLVNIIVESLKSNQTQDLLVSELADVFDDAEEFARQIYEERRKG